MKKIFNLLTAGLFFIHLNSAIAQNKTLWTTYFPGFSEYYYTASTDPSQDLNLALNYLAPGQDNKFLSLNLKGMVVYDHNTPEIALLNYRDSSGNRYLISYAQPVLHVQKYTSQNVLLWDNPLTLTNAVDTFNITPDQLILSSACMVTSNGKLAVAGLFKTDTVGFGYESLTVFFFDSNTGNLLNTFYEPGISDPIYKIDLQEDSGGNINVLHYNSLDQAFLKKISQTGTLLSQVQFGDTWNFTSQKISIKATPNFIYVAIVDSIGDLNILKMGKNAFDTVYYNLCLPSYGNFGDVFDGNDSIFYVSYDDGQWGGIKAYDYAGNVICNPTSQWANFGYRGFVGGGKFYTVRNELITVDGNLCSYDTVSDVFDPDLWNLIIIPAQTVTEPIPNIINNSVFYLMSRTLNGVLGVVGVIDEKENDFGGRMYFDINNNCIADSSEAGLVNQLIKIDPAGNYMFTDQNGYFENFLDTGIYSLSGVPFNTTLNFCPISVQLTINDTTFFYGNNNIGTQDATGNLQDLAVSINQSAAIPGYQSIIYITVMNKMPLPATGWVQLTIDTSLFTLNYSSPAADSVSGNVYYWHIDTLNLLNSANIYASLNVNVSATLGTVFTSTAQVNNSSGENYLVNNNDNFQAAIVGSFDPNNKYVYPMGVGSMGNITPGDTVLNYKIQFQNTGTFTAFDIFIIDTIDSSLDISTFQFSSASHSCKVSFLAPNVIKFAFDNIMLADSNANEQLSHGFVNYSIHTYPSLPLLTQIRNKAAIYFDFNAPVITNETVNTIDVVGLTENNVTNHMSIFPNPAVTSINISRLDPVMNYIIRIKDVLGHTVLSQVSKGSKCAEVNIASLDKGLYFVEISTNAQTLVKKIIKH